jgi:p-aminobenzoyl-glutamate transporter AbgT
MSLKAVHVAFIVLAIVLAGWVAVWAWGQGGGFAAVAGASALAGIGLVVYLVRFLKKMKGVSYL